MNQINLSKGQLEDLCKEIRQDFFKMVRTANSGHLGACSSSTELLSALYFGGVLNYDRDNPFDENRDLVLVRGHLGPLRYKIFSLLGWIKESELETYRQLGSRLQGHEDMELVPGVDITPSGSLGMLLSYGTGAALSNKRQNKDSRAYVFLGDGEEQEGNVSEAARHAAKLSLDNLVCILDRNRKQLSHPTSNVDQGDVKKIWEGYGWEILHIYNGHDTEEIKRILNLAKTIKKPVFVVADTIKGKEIEGCEESYNGYHTISSCPRERLDHAIAKIERPRKIISYPYKEFKRPAAGDIELDISLLPPIEKISLEEATDIYLQQVEKKIASKGMRIYFMTADLDDTEYTKQYDFTPLTQFLDVGIREQHLFASAYGISLTDPNSRIWIHSGDAFLYRALDQLYAICQGKGKMIILGERPGLGQGKNGSTHQSVGQPAALLALPNLTFLEPADTIDLYNCYNYAFSKYPGPVYIRLHPGAVEPLCPEGGANIDNYVVLTGGEKPHINLIGSGLAMKFSLDAVRRLEKEGINTRLINVVNPKTLDDDFVSKLASETPILTLYNGHPFVLESVVSSACMRQPKFRSAGIYSHGFTKGTSGAVDSLLNHYGYGVEGIESKIKGILK